MSNQAKYDNFRKTFPTFVFESYQYDVQPDGLHIVFSFRIGKDIHFAPTAHIPSRPFLHLDQPREALDALVFNIGMIELVSYWKCCCPPTVEVRCGSLSEKQIAFWKKIYYNGLGEFFYVNGIEASESDFMTIASAPYVETMAESEAWVTRPECHLVPIGGGKDSVVTMELLNEQSNGDTIPLIMNPRGATIGCIQAAGYSMDQVLVIRRTIHPHLLELNRQGYLNGHTPFSAMLAFYTLLAARLTGVPHIALSNESSANESTVIGSNVNHQYSKSLEFENDFRQYVAENLSGDYDYFSFLRPLSELQIAMLFSRYRQYHEIFRSCNVGSKQDVWCGHCAKCLFAYIILSPFIEPEHLNAIFGKNMLDDESLRPIFRQLTGQADTKPFECVGTISEVNSALNLMVRRWQPRVLPALLKDYHLTEPTTPLTTLFAQHNVNGRLLDLIERHVQGAAY